MRKVVVSAADFSVLSAELDRASDRAAAIVAGAFVDEIVKQLVQKSMCANAKKFNPPAARAVEFAHDLGLITTFERQQLLLLYDIRNIFAHSLRDLNFADIEVSKQCMKLCIPEQLLAPFMRLEILSDDQLYMCWNPLADRSNPRAVFSEATFHLLFVLFARMSAVDLRRCPACEEFTDASGPVLELLKYVRCRLAEAIAEAADRREVQRWTDAVTFSEQQYRACMMGRPKS